MENKNEIQKPPLADYREIRGTYYFSGILGINENMEYDHKDFRSEMKQVLRNISQQLEAASLSKENILFVQGFITDYKYFDILNEEWVAYFGDNLPARAIVGATLFPPFQVELIVTAAK